MESYFFIHLRPLDVLMFRPSRPFSATTDFEARSLDLPSPKTVAGAIASKFYKDYKGNSSSEILKEAKIWIYSYGWGIKSGNKYERMYPVPMGKIFKRVGDGEFLGLRSSLKEIFKKDPEEIAKKYFIREEGISKEKIKGFLVDKRKVYSKEIRIGIKLSKGKTAEEGYFYRAEFIRPEKDARIWILAKGSKDKIEGLKGSIIKLGGRGRCAEVEEIEEVQGERRDLPKKFYADLISYGRFKADDFERHQKYIPLPKWAKREDSIPRKGLQYFSGWDLKDDKITFLGYLAMPGSSYFGEESKVIGLLGNNFEFFKLENEISYLYEGDPEFERFPLNCYIIREAI